MFRFALASVLASSGCYFMQSAKAPMAVEKPVDRGPRHAQGLAILLPGFGDGPADFQRRGVVQRLEKRRFDVLCPNAHFGYYRSRTVVRRLQADVLTAARAAGYARPWLLGVSMGGMGWLAVAATTAPENQRFAGLVLLAPYLGSREVLAEIRQAGGLAKWSPGPMSAEAKDEHELTRMFWGWLKQNREAGWPVPVFLGYGEADDMSDAHRLLAAALPRTRVFVRSGGHKWNVWSGIFDDMLARDVFPQAQTQPAPVTTATAATTQLPRFQGLP